MKITNLNIANKHVHFENASMQFDRCGIYLIQGTNGLGITVLMETIVFDTLNVVFEQPEHRTFYHGDRSRLFAYVPKDIIESPVNVHEYLTKGNRSISDIKIHELMTLFRMEDILPTQAFVALSGDDKYKLAIISALLKETPYVLMDEPTIGLDDASVQLFIKILQTYAVDRTFIIISHDKRMSLNDIVVVVRVENNHIEFEAVPDNPINSKSISANQPRIPYLVLMYFASRNKINSRLLALFLICSLAFTLFTHFMFVTGFASNDVIPINGILVYSVDREYGELNRVYSEGEGLLIEESDHFKLIHYPDIAMISNITGVLNIYLPDLEYYHTHFWLPFSDENMLEEISVFSIPEVLRSSSKLNVLWVDTSVNHLTHGRLPNDDASEVSISVALLIEFFGYDASTVANAIGESITVDGISYTIVGIQHTDICMLSYSSGTQYGIYEYDSASYGDFASRTMQFLLDHQSGSHVQSMFIVTASGSERSVLNELMSTYPANNYFSNQYALIWDFHYNNAFIQRMTAIAVIVGITFGSIFLLFTKNQIQSNLLKIKDYENYFIDRKRIKRVYGWMKTMEYALIAVLCIAGSATIGLLSGYFLESIGILLLSLLLFVTPSLAFIFLRLNNVL